MIHRLVTPLHRRRCAHAAQLRRHPDAACDNRACRGCTMTCGSITVVFFVGVWNRYLSYPRWCVVTVVVAILIAYRLQLCLDGSVQQHENVIMFDALVACG